MTTAQLLNQPLKHIHDIHSLPSVESRYHRSDVDWKSLRNLPGPTNDGNPHDPMNGLDKAFRTRGNALAHHEGRKEDPSDIANSWHPYGILPLFGRAPIGPNYSK
jgi:hypothetical protein